MFSISVVSKIFHYSSGTDCSFFRSSKDLVVRFGFPVSSDNKKSYLRSPFWTIAKISLKIRLYKEIHYFEY